MRAWWIVLLVACNGDDPVDSASEGWRPELVCPGDDGCAPVDGGTLRAGAARVEVTPTCWEHWDDLDGNREYHGPETDSFDDCGCDRLCPGDEGYTGADAGEGDGVFQTIWVAGFQNARAMGGVRDASLGLDGEGDGLFASVVVLEQGNSTVAIVGVDGFGWMNPEVARIRADLAAIGVEVDLVVMNSTHSHNAPDSYGIYGPGLTTSGYDAAYAAEMRAGVVEAIRQAAESMVEVQLVAGQVDVAAYSDKGVANVVGDTRDPWVIDNTLNAAAFVATNGETVATLVNWANHPESTGSSSTLVSSNYAHALRKTVEQGVTWDSYSRAGRGGVCVFLQGALGGMMTPLHITPTDPDGQDWPDRVFEKSDVIGRLVGEMALDAIEQGQTVANPPLSFRRRELFLPIDNQGFQLMFLLGVIDRESYNWDQDQPISTANLPEVLTEIDLVELGPIRMITVPGELLPELAVGGYDGSMIHAPGHPLIDPDNPNPPDLTAAPPGPYLKDVLGGEHRWVLGLGGDALGYIVPEYDFVLDPAAPYLAEAEGDHYEETNSLGPRTADLVLDGARELIEWRPR